MSTEVDSRKDWEWVRKHCVKVLLVYRCIAVSSVSCEFFSGRGVLSWASLCRVYSRFNPSWHSVKLYITLTYLCQGSLSAPFEPFSPFRLCKESSFPFGLNGMDSHFRVSVHEITRQVSCLRLDFASRFDGLVWHSLLQPVSLGRFKLTRFCSGYWTLWGCWLILLQVSPYIDRFTPLSSAFYALRSKPRSCPIHTEHAFTLLALRSGQELKLGWRLVFRFVSSFHMEIVDTAHSFSWGSWFSDHTFVR